MFYLDFQHRGFPFFLGEKLKISVWEVLYASTTILTPDKSFSELTAGFGGSAIMKMDRNQ
jgi:hypothetical protein